jgi:hypothetical protein
MSLRADVFIIGLSSGIFTDEEIASWIRGNSIGGGQKVQLLEAISKLKGGAITGIIRTALREREGLPPVPDDAV